MNNVFGPEVRKIRSTTKDRIETGPLEVNDDWPGLFVRGDDCILLKNVLQYVLTGEGYSMGTHQAKQLLEAIDIVNSEGT